MVTLEFEFPSVCIKFEFIEMYVMMMLDVLELIVVFNNMIL